MACVAVASLLRTIELEFLQYKPRPLVLRNHLISFNKHLIQSFHQNLGFLITQFDDKRINMDGVEAVKHLEMKLRDLAIRVEDEIEILVAQLYDEEVDDEYLVGIADLFVEEKDELGVEDLYVEKQQRDTDEEKTKPCVKLGQVFQSAMEQIEAIKEELLKFKAEGRKTAHDVLQRSQLLSSHHASHSKEQMVGKKHEFEIIKKLLTELIGSKEKKVVSIIGMGGIGKTTLARQVYEDPSVSIHFDVRAWVVASQLHNKRQMLVGLLNSISKQDILENSTDEDLALKLYQFLKHQRYMVVIDDVWSREAWDDVHNCFPDDGNWSRVLLTTRLAEVANYTSFDNDFSHHMQLLDQVDSWNFFCEKAGKSRGAEFEIIWRPIVEKCKGLPLAIIVVAGLFSKLNTLNEWENIAKALDSSTTTIAATCLKILSLSYNHLPHHLKACFLYLGVFPEDHKIKANELSRLWSAEGLVKASENENFDVVAERTYTNNIADLVHLRYISPVFSDEYIMELFKAWNLQTSLSWLHPEHCTKEFFTHVPNVKKIRIEGGKGKCNDCIENLVSLQQLERLNINANEWDYTSPNIQINNHIVPLKSLKRLKFEGNHFEWNGINILCKLPRLEVLKLRKVAKNGSYQRMTNSAQLIYLEIFSTHLKDWKATGDHFPDPPTPLP
ncbi:putative late blight resistance protein homolog R1B-17 [Ipomoea triloba]|uniref:putative late blight resistance protein homolog R1B-17 n=1 Tax=Ipomoea triloba TaxID=35885 RepID=UPI00125CF9AD|nr:putative late blight resistance protein homolog R1B-17 [Ipomoea triloba]